jgi:putative ABC transport system permease protein
VQVAMTMVLMVGVGLLLRGLMATQTIDPGFEIRNVAFASYDLQGSYDPEEAAVFQRRLLEEVRALPGVEAAAQAITEPLNPDTENTAIRLPTQDRSQLRSVDLNAVTSDYFDVVGIPIVSGRAFADADMTDASVAVIITESTARNLWRDQDPVGQRLLLAVSRDREVALEIVGVARDAQVAVVGRVAPYYLYLPAAPRIALSLKLLVQSRTDFASTAAAIRAAAQRLDPGLAGVVAYFVGRRTREIAIRVALGARSGDVLAMILRRTMRPVVVGAVIGLAGAISLSRVLSSVLFGVSPFDPLGIGVAALFVLSVAFAAVFLPGRSATRRQPLAALHYE